MDMINYDQDEPIDVDVEVISSDEEYQGTHTIPQIP